MSKAADAEWTRVVSPEEAAGAGGCHPDIARSFQAMLPRLKRVVAGMGLTGPGGEDILQNVFVEALQKPPRLNADGQLRGWLVRVTTNRCLLEFRQRKRFGTAVERMTRDSDQSSTGNLSGESDAAARTEGLRVMRDALDELEPALLGPLVLRYYADMNATRIGEVLNLRPGTVRSRLHDARLFLARRLREKGIEP